MDTDQEVAADWEYVSCALCGADDPRRLLVDRVRHCGTWVDFPIVRCRRCGLIYTNPRHRGELSKGYHGPVSDDFDHYLTVSRAPIYRRGLAGIQRRLPDGRPPGTQPSRKVPVVGANAESDLSALAQDCRLLGVGCATGSFLRLARAHGFIAVGVELSPTLAAYARERHGLTVYERPLEVLAFAEASFDVVALWDVIEHVMAPFILLREIYRVLAPGGVLALRTGNAGFQIPKARLFRLLGPNGGPYLIPNEHLYHFTPRTLRNLVRLAGFADVEVEDSETEVYANRVKYRLMRFYNVLAALGQRLDLHLTNAMDVYDRKR